MADLLVRSGTRRELNQPGTSRPAVEASLCELEHESFRRSPGETSLACPRTSHRPQGLLSESCTGQSRGKYLATFQGAVDTRESNFHGISQTGIAQRTLSSSSLADVPRAWRKDNYRNSSKSSFIEEADSSGSRGDSFWSNFGAVRFRKVAWPRDFDEIEASQTCSDNFLASSSLVNGPTTPAGIMSPLGSFRRHWDYVMLLLLVYVATVSVFIHSFLPQTTPSSVWFWIERAIDVCFIADIALCFRTGIITRDGKLETRKETIAYHYVTTWFAVDAIGTFPWDLLLYLLQRHSPVGWLQVIRLLRIFRIFKATRILRILRLGPSITRFEVQLRIRYGHLRLVWLVVVMALVAHWCGCIFYLIGKLSGPTEQSWTGQDGLPQDNVSLYITALYFAMYTMSTVGYGDVVPQNNIERGCVTGMILVGALTFAFVISQVGQTVLDLSSSRSEYRKQLDALADFVSTHNVPRNLAFELRRYYQHRTTYEHIDSHREVIDGMSSDLKSKVMSHIYGDFLRESRLLNRLSDEKRRDVYSYVSAFLARPGQCLYHNDDPSEYLYAILHGHVDVDAPERGRCRIGPGIVFGEDGILFNSRRLGAANAAGYCYLAKCPRDVVIAALRRDPSVLRSLQLEEACMLWEQLIVNAERDVRFWMNVCKLRSMAMSRNRRPPTGLAGLNTCLDACACLVERGTASEDYWLGSEADNVEKFRIRGNVARGMEEGRPSGICMQWLTAAEGYRAHGASSVSRMMGIEEPPSTHADAEAAKAMDRQELAEGYVRRGRYVVGLTASLRVLYETTA